MTLSRGALATLIARARQHERTLVLRSLPPEVRMKMRPIPDAARLPANVFDIDPDLLGQVVAVLLKDETWRRQ